jgi:hypothetical protein
LVAVAAVGPSAASAAADPSATVAFHLGECELTI